MAFGSTRRSPFLPQRAQEPEELGLEHLTEEFLNALPDVEPQEPPPFPVAEPEPPVADPAEGSAFEVLFETLQTHAHMELTSQFARLHDALAAHMVELEARLADAERTIADLRDENARLVHQNDLFERAFANLKELTKDVDDAR